jgi:hypothetical protein
LAHFVPAAELKVPTGLATRTARIDEQDNATMRTFIIGNRMCAVALSAAFAFISSATPATASQFDGSWNMVVVTTNGHCGQIKVGLAISGGRISSTSGKFVFRPIKVAGLVSGSGQTRINAVAGPRKAEGIGRFNRSRGSGKWAGTGPSGVCSGVWTAIRS